MTILKPVPVSPPGEFVVERGIPAPASHGAKYPFSEMGVGDSFAVHEGANFSVRNAAAAYGRRTNTKFSVRKHGNAYRCWRIA